MSLKNEVQVRDETARYLRDAADATDKEDLTGALAEVKFEESEGHQIIKLHEMYEQANDPDAQQFIWVAIQTIEDPLDA